MIGTPHHGIEDFACKPDEYLGRNSNLERAFEGVLRHIEYEHGCEITHNTPRAVVID
jgi:hypothetical protein